MHFWKKKKNNKRNTHSKNAIKFQGVRSFIVASYGLVVQLPHGLRQPNTNIHARTHSFTCIRFYNKRDTHTHTLQSAGSCTPISVCVCVHVCSLCVCARFIQSDHIIWIQLLLLFLLRPPQRACMRTCVRSCVCISFKNIWLHMIVRKMTWISLRLLKYEFKLVGFSFWLHTATVIVYTSFLRNFIMNTRLFQFWSELKRVSEQETKTDQHLIGCSSMV